MSQYTKKHTENAFDYFRKHALSVAISAFSTTVAGIRDGLQRGVYVALIAGQVVSPVVWAANLPELAGSQTSVTIDNGASIDGIDSDKSAVYNVSGNRVLANWTSFDIANGYGVQFVQGSASSILVNQITGSASEIAGLLKANGNIILVNPNGMTIAGTAVIDVNSLVVSAMGLSTEVGGDSQAFFNSDTEAENYNNLLLVKTDADGKITIESGVKFTVDAEGTAHTRNNKFIAIGAEVENSADIVVGKLIGLGAGGSGFLSFDQDGLVGFEISSDVVSENALKSLGDLTATNGTVLLSANASNATINSALNIEGTVQAAAINIDADKITLGDIDSTEIHGVELNASESLNLDQLTSVRVAHNADYSLKGKAVSLSAGYSDVTTQVLNPKEIIANGSVVRLSDNGDLPETIGNLKFQDVSSVSLIGGSVSADSDANLIAASELVLENSIETNGISFSGVSSVVLNSNTLTGTSGVDTFDVTGANALTSAGIDFTNVASVNAGDGDDQVNTNGAALVSQADVAGTVAVDNALLTQQIAFTAVENLDLANGTLTGSDAADSFEVTGTTLAANAINVTNAASAIGAGTGDDVVTVNDANSTLTGTDKALNTAAYQFTSIESADLQNNALTGNSGTDTFDVTGANALTSAEIDFTNVVSVDAGDGDDQVNTNGADASLFAELGSALDYALETLGITFREAESANLAGGTLAGSSEADSFDVTGAALTANGVTVTNAASAIDAGTGDDVVTVNDANSTLTGTDNALNTAVYQFTSIETADLNSNALAGTTGADTFAVTGANALTSADIDFTNVASVDAGDGDDQVNTDGATLVSRADVAGTVAVDNALTTQQIAFTAVEDLDLANGTLTGSDAADSFEVTG
ncbi:beta strand repeat-containing protein, partial [Thalassolituus sp.]|uniref:beta strand repeat-containing protein n=2 Tax=Thalassolituus sp. TaxID=2030822 RepID=UPI00351858FE